MIFDQSSLACNQEKTKVPSLSHWTEWDLKKQETLLS
jgi:hypothetical protein